MPVGAIARPRLALQLLRGAATCGRVWVASALLTAGLAGAARQAETEVDLGLRDPWRWRSFDADAGLLDLRIRELEEGFDGTLWVGTDLGLHWYDGFEFRPASGTPRATTLSMAPLADGRCLAQFVDGIYIGDRDGFVRLDLGELAPGPEDPRGCRRVGATTCGAPVLHVFDAEDIAGYLLVGDATRREGRAAVGFDAVHTAAEMTPRPSVGVDPHRGRGYVAVERGAVTIAGEALRLAVPDRWVVSAALPDPTRGGVLLSVVLPWEERGIWEVTPQARSLVEPSRGSAICALDVGPNGEALALLHDGRVVTRGAFSGGWCDPFVAPARVAEATVIRFLASGDLLVGAHTGLVWLRRGSTPWAELGPARVGGGRQVFTLLTGRGGETWLGTAIGIVALGTDGTERALSSAGGHPLRDVTALAEDGHGRLWVGSGSYSFPGCLVLEGDAVVEHWTGPGFPAAVHALKTDGLGRVWVAGLPVEGAPGGLWVYDRGRMSEVRLPDPKERTLRVYAVDLDVDGALWVATTRGLYHGSLGDLRRVEAPSHEPARIWAVVADGAGGAWFGHGPSLAGLGHLGPDGAVSYVRPVDGSREPRVHALLADPAGRLWVGSDEGLLVLADGQLRRIKGQTFGVHTLTWRRGSVLVGTFGRGLIAFDPSPDAESPMRVTMQVDVVGRGVVSARWTPRPGWNEVPSAEVLTRHRLANGPWSEWSRSRAARVEGLAPGSHLMTIEALPPQGLGEVTRTSQAFTVPRPVWARFEVLLPAMLALVAAAAGLAWSTLRWLREARAHREATTRFQQFANHVRDVFWLVDWRARRMLYVNPAYEDVLGIPVDEILRDPRKWRERVHPDDRDWVTTGYRESLERDGEWDAEFRCLQPGGAVTWVHARAFAVRGPDGELARVAGIAEEITDRRQSEARQQRLSLELDHRVKNVLAEVAAIAEQTVSRSTDLAAFSSAFLGRVRSMARTHEALAACRWDGVPLRRVLATSLGPTAGDPRCALEGPDLVLTPRGSSSLGLALHELATNALKYGALAIPAGRVAIAWRVEPGEVVGLTWREAGVSGVRAPRRIGLGLTLVRGLIEHDLGGVVALRFEPGGVVCEFQLPGVVRLVGARDHVLAPVPRAALPAVTAAPAVEAKG